MGGRQDRGDEGEDQAGSRSRLETEERGSPRPLSSGEPAIWRLEADTGGTFTDCLATDPEGGSHRLKVLSSAALRGRVTATEGATRARVAGAWPVPEGFFAGCSLRSLPEGGEATVLASSADGWLTLDAPGLDSLQTESPVEIRSPDEAPVLAARLLTGTPHGASLPPIALRLATTRGTNALLERRGARLALLTTRGFADLLEIGTQARPDLFALAILKPRPLTDRVIEIDERLAADGSVLRPLDEDAVAAAARELRAAGIEAVAVAFLHAYRNPAHEDRTEEILRAHGIATVATSAALAPLVKILPRAQTAVVEAYLGPVVGGYLGRVRDAVGQGTLHVMTSAGGLVRAASYRAKDSLLSGPAGGVVGAARAGARSGFSRIVAFDVGGTSTDVARFDGAYEYLFEHQVGDARLAAPALAIESVAAGGGSICRWEGGRLQVRPGSAGAFPGPACYGAGGPLALTDVNLLLGRLEAERFEIPLSRTAAAAAWQAVRDTMADASEAVAPSGMASAPVTADEALLEGLVRIADERTADAIRSISLRRGYDPARYALVAFGGAGAQHACSVAELLDMEAVLVPPDAGLLSAVGLGAAVLERFAHRQVSAGLEEVAESLDDWVEELARDALEALGTEGVEPEERMLRRRILRLRLAGQDAAVEVVHQAGVDPLPAFRDAYRTLYGYQPPDRAIEVESIRVVASSRPSEAEPAPAATAHRAEAARARAVWFGEAWRETPVFERESLTPGARFDGPALVVERHSAAVIPPGWWGQVDGALALVLRRGGAPPLVD